MRIPDKFLAFCNQLRLEKRVIDIIKYRYESITQRLNTEYWNSGSYISHSLYTGSYGRGTYIHGSNINMLFQLPDEVYEKFNNYPGNKQSALLQEVKSALDKKFKSPVRADEKVIRIDFTDGICFELIPCFKDKDNFYTYPDKDSGGSWKTINPEKEITEFTSANQKWNKNLKRLCRMVRAWKDKLTVPICGLLIDTLAYNFMKDWKYKNESFNYYDWMTRDFFEYLKTRDENQKYWLSPGANHFVWRTGKFEIKAKQAYNITLEALDYESRNKERPANQKWRDIYGTKFPVNRH